MTILRFDDVVKIAKRNPQTYKIQKGVDHTDMCTNIIRRTKNETRILFYGSNKTQPSIGHYYTNGQTYVDSYGLRHIDVYSTNKSYKIPKKFKNAENFIKFWRKMLPKIK